MNFKRFFIILPIVVLTGCTTVREARKVQRGEDSPIGERMPTAAELGLTSDKAATLADLEEVALKANPAVRKAVNGVNMAFLAIKIKKADFLPMITASAGHSRTTRNTNKHNYDYDTVGTYNAGINLDLMIFDFGKTNAAVRYSSPDFTAIALKKAFGTHTTLSSSNPIFSILSSEKIGPHTTYTEP